MWQTVRELFSPGAWLELFLALIVAGEAFLCAVLLFGR